MERAKNLNASKPMRKPAKSAQTTKQGSGPMVPPPVAAYKKGGVVAPKKAPLPNTVGKSQMPGIGGGTPAFKKGGSARGC